jgi:hypothetical protein
MVTVQQEIDGLMEQLIMLCEVRGELGPEGNAATELKIVEIENEIGMLRSVQNYERNKEAFDASCEI